MMRQREQAETVALTNERPLRSNRATRGASLPMALLLFLICALLASVVLAASTTASGRHSHLAKTDQRYYSVVSATQLIQDEFEKQPVVVTCVQEKTVTTRVSYSNGKTSPSTSEQVDSVTLTIRTEGSTQGAKTVYQATDSGGIDTTGLTLPERTALCVMLGRNMADIQASASMSVGDLWDAALFNAEQGATVGTYKLTHSITSDSSGVGPDAIAAVLATSVHEETDESGSLSFIVSTASQDEKDDPYSVTLTCDADIDTVEEEFASEPNVSTTASVRTETKKVTSTRMTTIRWAGAGVTKGGSE